MSVSTIWIRRAPVSEPPAEPAGGEVVALRPTRHRQLSLLPWAEDDPTARAATVADRRTRVAANAGMPGALDRYFGPQRTPAVHLDEVTTVATVFCTAVAEVLTGWRSGEQLRERCSRRVFAWIDDHTSPRPRAGAARPPAVTGVRVCQPADGIAEVSAVVHHGPRARAIVARLVGLDGSWRCVLLQVV